MKQTYFDNSPALTLMSPAEAEALDKEQARAFRQQVILLGCALLVGFGGWMLG